MEQHADIVNHPLKQIPGRFLARHNARPLAERSKYFQVFSGCFDVTCYRFVAD